MQDFVHLHVHTQYSVLDGQASIPNLVNKAIGNGMRGIAITDHGNMMGIKEFHNYVKKINGKRGDGEEKFKPIIGCEMYVAERRLFNRDQKCDIRGHHLIVLAKNEQGYHNLVKLVSKAWTDGFYYVPRTDKVELEKYREGLIVSSACLGGELPQLILKGHPEDAEKALQWYINTFGDDYYLELQLHKATVERANHETYPLQVECNKKLIEFAHKYNVKTICTNDVHFVDEENAEAHDRLICLSTGRDLDDPTRMLYSKQEWMKTKEEMNALFADVPETLANTVEIYDKVEFYDIDHAPIMPNFQIPAEFGSEERYREQYSEEDLFNEFTCDDKGNVIMSREEGEKKIKKMGGYSKLYRIKFEADYLKELTMRGAKERYGDPIPSEVLELLNFELHIMKTMGFPGYFLIVQDFISAARTQLGVSVGPGRGSAAGSAVAYCLGITQIDPIKYNLLFERFLNPDRISLPDIDVDFDDDGRGAVLNWVTQKYGKEKVAHIITYGTMASKLAIKDVARVQKLPLSESNRLCKLIPDRIADKDKEKVKKIDLNYAISSVPELQQAEASPDPILSDTIKYARMLEGNVRNTGVHACGTIICRDDITDWVPVAVAEDKETGEKLIVTQYEGSVIEDTGLIKMDFLGLKTLSIIKEAVENVRESLGINLDIDRIPLDDPLTYKLYCEGRTIGTFQFESTGMQKYLRELQPSTFEDLIAMNALYRPGPMSYIPDFIERKQGRKAIEYDIPVMEKYLKDTYGITVYQEQVMLLSRLLAGFTRGESDTLRKAMGKKQKDKLDHLKPKFIEGGTKNGHDPKALEKIWGDWEKFASYAFNKSHATCYSWVAYQTAYLKAHYPSQYMAADLSRSLSNITDITKFMDECKVMGIQVLGPDVNESRMKFSVNAKGDIRFGLAGIKGVGGNAVQSILSEREKNGPFTSIFNFVQRVNLQACNRKNLECLALSGAFDCFSQIEREQYFQNNSKNEPVLDTLIRYGNRYQADRQSTINSLFGMDNEIEMATPDIPPVTEHWSDLYRLDKERELVGIYLSAHPLDQYRVILEEMCSTKVIELNDLTAIGNRSITLGGVVTALRTGVTKNNKPYGAAKIEDFSGSTEIALFGNDWIKWKNNLDAGNFLYFTGSVGSKQYRPEELEFKVGSIRLLEDVKEKEIEKITLTFSINDLTEDIVSELTEYADKNPGRVQFVFQVKDFEEQINLSLVGRSRKISIETGLINYLKSHDEIEYRIN